MMNMNEFLDQKHGKFIGRIYMLVVLFCANALIPIGAVMRFLYGGSSVLMIIGIIITDLLDHSFDSGQIRQVSKSKKEAGTFGCLLLFMSGSH